MVKSAKTDRKKRIVDAALTIFVQKGVAQTKMNEIADLAKVDQPLIHYYFPTLESLYVDVITQVLETLKEPTIKAMTKNPNNILKTLEDYIRVPFIWSQKNKGMASLWLYFYHLASFHSTFTQLNNVIMETGRSRIAVLIYSGLEKNVFKIPAGMTVSETALNIQGLITGNTILAGSGTVLDWKVAADNTVAAVLAWIKV